MKKIITVMMWFAMLAACEQAEQKTPLLPLEDFFRNPEKTAFQLSPNGEYFSYLAPWETRLNIFVQ
ncbi:MAG: hypothetical protein WBK43_00115, partial [Prolixibacteraceae bacterium]